MKTGLQFSTRSIFCLIFVLSILLMANLSPTVSRVESFTPPGDISSPFGPTHDSLSLERGFPLRYQQSEELFPYQTLTNTQVDTWYRKIGVRVTHFHWLAVNVLFTLSAVAIFTCSLEILLRRPQPNS